MGEECYPGAAYYGEDNSALYDEAMQYVDVVMGHFLDGLKKIPSGDGTGSVYDKAVIMVTADHGTGLNEHGKYAGFFSYQEQIRVPLMIKIPGVERKVIATPVTQHDEAPTLVNLVVSGGKERRFDGVSLLPLISGKETTIDREFIINICAFHDSFAVIQNVAGKPKWKLIYNRDLDYYMLYDLENDPHELHSIADGNSEKCRELIAVLERFLWQGRDTYANPKHYE